MSNLIEEFRNTLRSNINDTEVLNKIDTLLGDVRKLVMYDLGNKEYKSHLNSSILLPIEESVKVLTGNDITVRTIKQTIAKFAYKLICDKHMCVSVIFDTKPLKSWISRVSKKLYNYTIFNLSDDVEHIGEFMMEMDKIPKDLPIKQVIITVL
jgi:hypothetical protein